jgi:hypothetical protein
MRAGTRDRDAQARLRRRGALTAALLVALQVPPTRLITALNRYQLGLVAVNSTSGAGWRYLKSHQLVSLRHQTREFRRLSWWLWWCCSWCSLDRH